MVKHVHLYETNNWLDRKYSAYTFCKQWAFFYLSHHEQTMHYRSPAGDKHSSQNTEASRNTKGVKILSGCIIMQKMHIYNNLS